MYPEFGNLGFTSIYLIDNMGISFLSFIILPGLIILRFTIKLLLRFKSEAKINHSD